jgi:hypothetical protein
MMAVLHYHIQFLGGVVATPPIRSPCNLREFRVSVVNSARVSPGACLARRELGDGTTTNRSKPVAVAGPMRTD